MGQFGGARDLRSKPYTIEDIRFTTKGDALYCYLLAPQPAVQAVIKRLASNSPHIGGRKVKDVTVLGNGKLEWTQGEQGLSVKIRRDYRAVRQSGCGSVGCCNVALVIETN